MLYVLTGILIALLIFGLVRGCSLRELGTWAFSSVRTAKNITIVMILVGALTALWRAYGTIPYIVSLATGALTPALFLPATFLLNCFISVLTGTSVGTAATMGVICMSVGQTLGVDPAICGGAILSGAYFGDRCSPVSTSALLVAQVTKTNLYDNIRGMIRTGWLPTILALAGYGVLGFFANANGNADIGTDIFEKYFSLHWSLALPAISILLLALFRCDVKINMLVSIAISIAVYFIAGNTTQVENGTLAQIQNVGEIMLFGFDAPEEIATMLSGGGMLGMMKLIFVVLISLTFAGLFKGFGFIGKTHQLIFRVSKKVSPMGCTVITAIATSALACNQTLAIILTNEICAGVLPDEKKRAVSLENTAVIIAPLVPWTVASLVPLGTIGAPSSSILFAFFLILTPITQVIWQTYQRQPQKKHGFKDYTP